MRRTILLF